MKMTVGKKLYAGFISILLLMGIIGWNGISKMQSINQNTSDIANNWLPGVRLANDLNYLTEHILALDLKTIIEPDQSRIGALENASNQGFAKIDMDFNNYEKLIFEESDHQNFTKLKTEWTNYKSLHDQFVELSKHVDLIKGAGNDGQKMIDVLRQSETSFNNMQKSMDALVKYNQDGADKAKLQASNTYHTGVFISLVFVFIGVVVSLIIAFFLTRSISKPVRTVSEALEKISHGDLTLNELKVKNKDEVGDLVLSLNAMVSRLRTVMQQAQEVSIQVAASSEELTASADQTTMATEQVATATQQIASGSENQLVSVSEAATAVNQMSSGIQQVAANSAQVSDLASHAFESTKNGTNVVNDVISQMNDIDLTVQNASETVKLLGSRSKEIGEIVKMITDIANQTNLLALNAAIEAARAGEHGHGFAVVADEVRKLAEQSAQSAQQISTLITVIQKETDNAVFSMDEGTKKVKQGVIKTSEVNDSFGIIQSAINNVTAKVKEVSLTVQQMAEGSQQIVGSIEAVRKTAEDGAAANQETAASTEETLATMEEVTSSAKSLSTLAEDLQMSLSKFKL